jgi:GNAT superfamily N-acetyltransferase
MPNERSERVVDDVVFSLAPDERDAAEVAALLAGEYWTQAFSHSLMARAHLGSQAWVVARGVDGELLGSARAVSDGARFAWVLDVIVREGRRGSGLGTALMTRLLALPALRGVAYIGLRTRDAHGLYARFGFVSAPETREQMGLRRAPTL